jgi:hypothetical protein
MNRYRIIVEQLVPDEKLVREEDRRLKPAGRYLYAAGDPEQALHRFRREIPIANVADFKVEIEEFKEGASNG